MESALPKKKSRETREEAVDRIRVAIRCRPLLSNERSLCEVACTRKNQIGVIPKNDQRYRNKLYDFDIVYDSSVTQEHLFETGIKPIINDVLSGYNCTVFAYGQTGTGKTFTMEGNRFNPRRGRRSTSTPRGKKVSRTHETDGIIPRSIIAIFNQLSEARVDYAVTVSHLEIYNEELSDLLCEHEGTGKRLTIYHDTSAQGRGVFVQGLEEIVVRSPKDIFEILKKSMLKRSVAATNLNERSSRSHCIFSIVIHMKETTEKGEEVVKTGTLNLVDLAGSESIGRSGAVDTRAKEAGHINTSLLALGRCISALVERRGHIPYRESKLTRLLQESLGGRNKTLLIATVSPSSPLETTLSTLDYALRAKSIQNKPQVNVTMSQKAYVKELQTQISALRRQIGALRAEKGVILPQDQFDEMETMITNQSAQLDQLNAVLESKNKQLEDIQMLFNNTKEELDEMIEAKRNVDEQLNQTQCELSHVNIELGGHKFALEQFDHVDMTVRREATQVKDVLENALTEKTLLFEKVEKQSELEEMNMNRLREKSQDLNGFVQGIQKKFQAFHSSHLNEINTTTKQIERVQQSYSSLEEENARVMESFGKLMQKVTDSTTGFVSTLSNMTKMNEELNSTENQFLTNMRENLNEFRSGIEAYIGAQRGNMNQLDEQIQSLANTMHSNANERHANLSSFCDSICHGIVNFTSRLNKRHETEMNEMRQFKEEYDQYTMQIEEAQKRQTELIQKRLDRFHQFDQSRRELSQTVTTNFQSMCEDGLTKMKRFQSQNDTQFNDKLQSISRLNHDTNSNVSGLESTFQRFNQTMEENVHQFDQHRSTSFQTGTSMMNEFEQNIHTLNHETSSFGSTISESSQKIWQTIHDNNSTILSENGKMSHFGESFHHYCVDHGNEMNVLSERCGEMKFDAYDPRGITPIRKHVRYPQQFTSRPILDHILDEYRQKQLQSEHENLNEEDIEMTDPSPIEPCDPFSFEENVSIQFEEDSLGLKIFCGENNKNTFVRHCENHRVADGAQIIDVDGCDVMDKSISYVRTLLSSKKRPISITFKNPPESIMELDQENIQVTANT